VLLCKNILQNLSFLYLFALNCIFIIFDRDLGNLNLSGTLAPELGQLEKLFSLDLSSNSISGAIPAALGDAKSLTFL